MTDQTLGQLLRTSRKRHRGMTQSELGDALGVSQGTVSAWERDRWAPPKSQWRRLGQMLGITRKQIEEALGRTVYPPDGAPPHGLDQIPVVGIGSGKTMAFVAALLAAMEGRDAIPIATGSGPDVMTLTGPDGKVTIIEAKASGDGIAVLANIDARLERIEGVMAEVLGRLDAR